MVNDTQTLLFESQSDWESGNLSGMVASDPAGKLSLAVDINQVAALVDEGSLAVFSRLDEGSGTTVANLGAAADGTINSGTWVERNDGRHYLSAGQIQYPYHSSMAVTDDNGKAYVLSAGLRIRLSTVTAQVFMQRANRFSLGVDSNGYPYATYEAADGTHKATGKQKIEAGKWYYLVVIVNQASLTLMVNGSTAARNSGFDLKDDPKTGDLVVSCTGDFSTVAYSGDGSRIEQLVRQSTSGIWEKKIDLGAEDWTVQYLSITTVKNEHEHSISVSVAFADSEDELPFAKEWSWTPGGGVDLFVPPELGLIYGHWISIRVRSSAMDWDRDQPLIDRLELHLRVPYVPLTEYEDDEYIGGEYITPHEEQGPEDLAGALAEIRKLKANITELKRRTSSLGGGFRGLRGRVNTLEDKVDEVSPNQAAMFVYNWTGDAVLAAQVSGNPTWRLLALEQAVENIKHDLSGMQQTDINYAVAIGTNSGNISALQDSVNQISADLNDHIGRSTNVHGVADGSAVASLNNVDLAIQEHDGAQDPHSIMNWASVGTVDSKILAHNTSSSPHSNMNWDDDDTVRAIVNSACADTYNDAKNYADDAVANHNGSGSAHSSMGWQTSTDVWDIAEQAADSAVDGHQNRCSNYAL